VLRALILRKPPTLVGLAVACCFAAHLLDVTLSPLIAPGANSLPMVHAGLFDWLFGGPMKEGRGAPYEPPTRPQPEERPRPRPEQSGTFKTVCVRLCDGYFFPISPVVTRDSFKRDAERCEKSCPGRSRLFTVRGLDGKLDDMVDLEGRPYRDLPTAFQHQTRYDPTCTCRGNPWDEEALARHRAYAEEAQKKATQVAQKAPTSETPRRQTRETRRAYRQPPHRRDVEQDAD
jgi:Protein of unknown function (DUF2865)